MKKLFIILGMAGYLLGQGAVYADTVFNVPITVTIPKQLELAFDLYKVPAGSTDPFTDGTLVDRAAGGGMDFGTLRFATENGMNIFVSDYYYMAVLCAYTSKDKYTITQSCTGIAGSAGNLNYNIVMKPHYYYAEDLTNVPADDYEGRQGSIPSGAEVGDAALVVGTDHLIYDSGTGGLSRIVRCYYGVATNDPKATIADPDTAKVLTSDAAAGTYSGTVTFTLTTY